MLGKNSMLLAALCAYTPCQSPKKSLASSHNQCKAQTISLTFSAFKTPQNTWLKQGLLSHRPQRDARCPVSSCQRSPVPCAPPGSLVYPRWSRGSPQTTATKQRPGALQAPEQLTHARQQPHPCGCVASGGAGIPEGRCAVRFPPSCPALPCPASRRSTLPFPCPRHTLSQEETRPRTAGSHQTPTKSRTHTPGMPGYLDGASQRGGGRAPHQLAEELRPPAAARRLAAGGRGPDAGGRRQVEVGRVEAEPRLRPAGARLRGAEGEQRRQQRPEQRGARRRGHPEAGPALAAPGGTAAAVRGRERGRRRSGHWEGAGAGWGLPAPLSRPACAARCGLGRDEAQPRPPGRAVRWTGRDGTGEGSPGWRGCPRCVPGRPAPRAWPEVPPPAELELSEPPLPR